MTINTVFDPPAATDTVSVFKSKAFALIAKLNIWSSEANDTEAGINANAATVSAATTLAVNAANAAATFASVVGTSATNATPAKVQTDFTYVEAARTIYLGQRLRVASRANPSTNFASGLVVGWNAGTKTVSISVDTIGTASAAANDWNILPDGEPGVSADLRTPKVVFTTNGTLVKANAGAQVTSTNAAAILLLNAAVLGNGWAVSAPQADNSFALTLNTTGGETISVLNGAAGASKVIPKGCPAILWCDGVGFTLVLLTPMADSEVTLTAGNGNGSVNTAIARFTTPQRNVGNDITYADSATLGASFTINTPGLYAITVVMLGTAGNAAGVSVNSAQLTTGVQAITAATRPVYCHIPNANQAFVASTVVRLAAGDVVRCHITNAGANADANSSFSIKKVGA